jgi:hypothetical protein
VSSISWHESVKDQLSHASLRAGRHLVGPPARRRYRRRGSSRSTVGALELGALAGVRLYGTCSARDFAAVERLGAAAIDYRNDDFVLGCTS